jgi:membrane associated rhomboid family serine protease
MTSELLLPPPVREDVVDGSARRRRIPFLTWVACAVCVIVFIGLLSSGRADDWTVLQKWGYHSSDSVRNGALWSLVTSSFVHIAVWHFLFNLYWLFHLGKTLERAIGSFWWLLFFIGASIVSSGYQLGVSDDTGHGASGVAYAMFGFMWLNRKHYPAFAELLDRQTVFIFFIWLVGCIVATHIGVAEIGNSAHVTGMIFGVLCGALLLWKSRRRAIVAGLTVFTLGSVLVVFWAPWSADWSAWRAHRAHAKDEYKTAIHWYDRADALGFDRSWCLYNKGMAYWALGDTSSYQSILFSLRALDKPQAEELERDVAIINAPNKAEGR